MKRIFLIFTILLVSLAARAQDGLLDRVKAANAFETIQLSFVQTRHSSMLPKDLVSEGRMVMAAPDRIRWEVLKPVHSLFVSSGELAFGGRRFRMPTEKDFTVRALEGEDVTLTLVPVRRDLKQLFREVVVRADKNSLQIRSALLVTPDGDWTLLEFKDVRTDQPVDPKLFEKE